MKLKMMILSLLCGVTINHVRGQDTDLPKPDKSKRLTVTKTIDVGQFKKGEGRVKRVAGADLITTNAQLKAFYKALGKTDVPKIDFDTTMLLVDKWPSWDRNRRFYYFTLDGKGDLRPDIAATEKGFSKPKKGPYLTRIALLEIPRKGVKTYEGKPLEELNRHKEKSKGEIPKRNRSGQPTIEPYPLPTQR